VLVLAGQYAEAIPDLDEAIKGLPDSAFLLSLRGTAKLRTGDHAGADADFAQAKKIEPTIR
jgi:Flp pilus assembly protein TadD